MILPDSYRSTHSDLCLLKSRWGGEEQTTGSKNGIGEGEESEKREDMYEQREYIWCIIKRVMHRITRLRFTLLIPFILTNFHKYWQISISVITLFVRMQYTATINPKSSVQLAQKQVICLNLPLPRKLFSGLLFAVYNSTAFYKTTAQTIYSGCFIDWNKILPRSLKKWKLQILTSEKMKFITEIE